jgi:hypothetical protein
MRNLEKCPECLQRYLHYFLKKNGCMSAYSLLDAISFDISFIEIRQEIKLLQHFGIIKDHISFGTSIKNENV